MKNLLNLTLAFFILISFFSCKKGYNDLIPTTTTASATSNFIQSAPIAAKSTPGQLFSIGELTDFVILGAHHTEVHPENNTIVNGGKVGVGPTGKYHHHGTYNANVYIHNGVDITEHGILNGTLYTSQNLGGLKGNINQVAHNAEDLDATVTLNDVNAGITIQGNGSRNVIYMHKLKLDNNEDLVLSGNANEVFIINIEEDFEMSGNARIITANGAVSSRVIINIMGTGTKATSKASNVINATILAADRDVEFGNVNGQIITAGKSIRVKKDAVVNYIKYNG